MRWRTILCLLRRTTRQRVCSPLDEATRALHARWQSCYIIMYPMCATQNGPAPMEVDSTNTPAPCHGMQAPFRNHFTS